MRGTMTHSCVIDPGPGVRVKAIDFCNYVEGAGELDTNFGAGLDRLSRMLESIVADS